MNEWVPTPYLRFVDRPAAPIGSMKVRERVLQQWIAPDVPKYMVDPKQGEWRDVPLVEAE